MSNLKELTWEHHKNAERQSYVKVLLSGKINPKFYATYLWNQHKKYDLLEALAGAQGCLDDLPDIRRKMKIEQDFLELWKDEESLVAHFKHHTYAAMVEALNSIGIRDTENQMYLIDKHKPVYDEDGNPREVLFAND